MVISRVPSRRDGNFSRTRIVRLRHFEAVRRETQFVEFHAPIPVERNNGRVVRPPVERTWDFISVTLMRAMV